VNETSLHYVRGGRGSAVILIHGFPEDWVEYRAVMPRLAQRFTVVAATYQGPDDRCRRPVATTLKALLSSRCDRRIR